MSNKKHTTKKLKIFLVVCDDNGLNDMKVEYYFNNNVELTPSDLSHLIALLKSEIKKYPNLEGEEGKTLLKKLSEVSKC